MYALKRGGKWITAPEGDGQPIPPVLAICSTSDDAWAAPDLETALERATLLRFCWGWNTEIRAIR